MPGSITFSARRVPRVLVNDLVYRPHAANFDAARDLPPAFEDRSRLQKVELHVSQSPALRTLA